MPKNKNMKHNSDYMEPEFAGTDPQKVKKEIVRDIKNGQGAITSREAGGMQD